MSASDPQTNPSIDREEHDGKTGARRTTLWGYDAVTDTAYRVGSLGRLVTEKYDAIVYTNTSGTVDTYTYKSGGTSGTTVATVTITYTDNTKATISTIEKT